VKMKRWMDFIGKRYFAYGLSIFVIVASWLYGGLLKGPKFGIDFTGGLLIQAKFKENVGTEFVRSLFKKENIKSVSVQNLRDSKSEFLIRLPVVKNPEKVTAKVREILEKNDAEVRKVEMIGPTIGKELKRKGILALIYATIGIFIYIAWRFETIFAVGAILALIHDTLATVGIFMSDGREFSLPVIASLLTIIGYSINDTIVVYDRIRENMKTFLKKKRFEEIVNDSINQTLSRTIITSLTTLFVVLTIYLFGGASLNDFAFVLLVGIIVGTYSSIFVASSIVVDWYKKVKKHI